MIEPVTIEWIGEPVGKGRPKFTRRGKFVTTYTPEKTVFFEEAIKVKAAEAMAGRPPIDGPVEVWIEARFTLPKSKQKLARNTNAMIPHTVKPDADNVAKGIMDALNAIVVADDKAAFDLRIRKIYATGLNKPGITIHIRPA